MCGDNSILLVVIVIIVVFLFVQRQREAIKVRQVTRGGCPPEVSCPGYFSVPCGPCKQQCCEMA